jgi:hypothetical protein
MLSFGIAGWSPPPPWMLSFGIGGIAGFGSTAV